MLFWVWASWRVNTKDAQAWITSWMPPETWGGIAKTVGCDCRKDLHHVDASCVLQPCISLRACLCRFRAPFSPVHARFRASWYNSGAYTIISSSISCLDISDASCVAFGAFYANVAIAFNMQSMGTCFRKGKPVANGKARARWRCRMTPMQRHNFRTPFVPHCQERQCRCTMPRRCSRMKWTMTSWWESGEEGWTTREALCRGPGAAKRTCQLVMCPEHTTKRDAPPN